MIREVAMYQVVCDEPGCDFKTGDDGGDYTGWGDHDQALDDWRDSGYQDTPEGQQFCDEHRKPECCGCGKTEHVVQAEDGGDWFCPACLADEISELPGSAPSCRPGNPSPLPPDPPTN